VIVGAGNTAYVSGLRPGDPVNWQIFRPGDALTDPDTGELLGYDAIHLGDARVKRFGSPSTVEITRASQEINQGDHLVPAREVSFPSYVPHAPDKPIRGTILSVRGGVSDIAQYSIVTINRGSRDGMEVGYVLATVHRGDTVRRTVRPSLLGDIFDIQNLNLDVKPAKAIPDTKIASTDANAPPPPAESIGPVVLPDERSGLVFVFRTFEKLSYAMVMKSYKPISVGDMVETP
jgi:hypothetical protein